MLLFDVPTLEGLLLVAVVIGLFSFGYRDKLFLRGEQL